MHHPITLQQSGQSIRVSPGDTIELDLEENPTTGYSWAVEDMPSGLTIQHSNYELLSGTGIGGGGRRKMLINVEQTSNGSLRLQNRQPWSGDVYQSFELTLTSA